MKKIIFLLIICFILTGCSKTSNESNIEIKENNFINVSNNDGKIVIDTENITSTATFVNYEIDGITIQFIVVRGTDDVVRIAFNTCQVCSPSPMAYFVQKGEYLECQNCGTKFHIDKIGIEKVIESENQIIIDTEYVKTYKSKFKNWDGVIS